LPASELNEVLILTQGKWHHGLHIATVTLGDTDFIVLKLKRVWVIIKLVVKAVPAAAIVTTHISEFIRSNIALG
jgi:hypothetical protein